MPCLRCLPRALAATALLMVLLLSGFFAGAQVADSVMQRVYRAVSTPYKYGVVLSAGPGKMADSPTVFRLHGRWYMSYIVFDGHGYESWLATSDDLLHWKPLGKVMSFTPGTWDASQKAGYPALIDLAWGGSMAPQRFGGRYWISYLGGSDSGYEAGRLGVGMAFTQDLGRASSWQRLESPVLSPRDPEARWYDRQTIFKSTVIRDPSARTGYPFVMFYNAAGDSTDARGARFESIAMAGSRDMRHWTRLGDAPVITRGRGICGDAQIVRMDSLYVMFYFGHGWTDGDPSAFDRFACSYDLLHWTTWTGRNLVEPSEDYDRQYAHKPWVLRWKGVVYHFYNAVGSEGRVIAVATSVDLKK